MAMVAAVPLPEPMFLRCRIIGERATHLTTPKPWSERQRTMCGLADVLVVALGDGPMCPHCARLEELGAHG